MTKKEGQLLARLLTSLYPNDKTLASSDAAAAWYLLLQPWDYDAVKNAVLTFARSGKGYPPHADDIAAMLPRPEADTTRQTPNAEGIIGNVRAWAIVTGREMPEGMTAAEALRWYERQQTEAG